MTNSRYGRFGHNDRLAYRMVPQDALQLVPAVIEKGPKPGALQARLYPGTSQIKVQGPQGQGERGAMYAAMLPLYHRNSRLKSKCAPGYTPKTGDEVWAEIAFQHRRSYSFWKVLAIRPKDDEQKPQTMQGSTRTRCVAGRVLITNENIN